MNGRKTGAGKYQWSDGSSYAGELVNDQLQGVGHYKWNDGRSYTGEWKNGVMNGVGELTFEGKSTYKGNFANNMNDGYGVYKWLTKDQSFAGYWAAGKQHGLGVLTKGKEVKYGLWVNGNRQCYFEEAQVKSISDGALDWQTLDAAKALTDEQRAEMKHHKFYEPAGLAVLLAAMHEKNKQLFVPKPAEPVRAAEDKTAPANAASGAKEVV